MASKANLMKTGISELSEPTIFIPRGIRPVSSVLLATPVTFAHAEALCITGMLMHPEIRGAQMIHSLDVEVTKKLVPAGL